jgi:hypothetical protein
MSHCTKLPVLWFREKTIFTDVLVSEHCVAVELERVAAQGVEQDKRIRASDNKASSAADILEPSLNLAEMPCL